MARVQLSTLPLECREKIWMLALLPDPSVYQFDPAHFRHKEGTSSLEPNCFEDERWMIPKHRYPTAMHVCHESRNVAFQIIEREQKQQQQNGILPYYCLGSSARPFNPHLDTFWFAHANHLSHPYAMAVFSVVGNRVHAIKNLAFSSCYIGSLPRNPGGNTGIACWNGFRWHRLGRYVSVKRVHVVFGETWVGANGEYKPSCNDSLAETKAPVLQLAKWTKGLAGMDTPDEVQLMMDKVKSNVVECYQEMFERTLDEESGEPPLPDGAPAWQDGSEITFHAAQILKIKAS